MKFPTLRRAAEPSRWSSPEEVASLAPPVEPKRVDLVVRNAQISNIDIERSRDDTSLDIYLRMQDDRPALRFSLSPTSAHPDCNWYDCRIEAVINQVLDFFSASSFGKCKGRIVRVLADSHSGDSKNVWAIGDYLGDRWFSRFGYVGNEHGTGANRFSGLHWPGRRFVNEWGHVFRLHEVYACGHMNARIKLASIVPGEGNSMSIVLKMSEITNNSKFQHKTDATEITVRFHPREMSDMSRLIVALCQVGGVDNLERLNGRLVRMSYPSMPDVTTSGIERELERHFYVSHPILAQTVDMADFGGRLERLPSIEHS
jgi:hypothetical protein